MHVCLTTVSLPERGQLLGVEFPLSPLANERDKMIKHILTSTRKKLTFVEDGTPDTESAPSIPLLTSCYEIKIFFNALTQVASSI